MQSTHKFTSVGFRAIHAESISYAAKTFARRLARRKYGKRGTVKTLNCTAWSRDYSSLEYSAFVGYRSGPNTTSGHTVHFTVSRA